MIDNLKEIVESGNFTHKEVTEKFEITPRQLYYLVKKYGMQNNLITDRSFMKSSEFSQAISRGNSGKIRSEEQRENYRTAAAARFVKNNRGDGWHHSPETIEKITNSNLQTYENLPQKWLDACILNDEWFIKLSENAPLTKDAAHTHKVIESKVGMSYEEWQIVRGEYDKYCAEVRKFTERQTLNTLENYDKRGTEYHLDHKFSMHEGFRMRVSSEIVGNITNLRMITAQENLTKNKNCSITLQQLLEEYDEHSKRTS